MQSNNIDEPLVIPVPQEERIKAQKNASENLRKKEFTPQSARIHEVNIDDFVADLTAAFQNGFTVEEACSFIGIDPSTYYRHLKKNPSFAEKMARAKLFTELKAKERVTQILVKGSDKDAGPMARWLLEKKQPAIYGNQVQLQQNNQQNNFYVMSKDQIEELCKMPEIANTDPSELLELLESSTEDESKENSSV